MRLRVLVVLLAVTLAAVSWAGDIQVVCEPGLRVYLDDKLMGLSTAQEDGLFLAKVRPGAHVVRVEKEGLVPQNFNVLVEKLPIEVTVHELVPLPATLSEKETAKAGIAQPTGSLVVLSAPQNCSVEIDGKPELKTTPVFRIDGLTAGDHTVAFSRPGYKPVSKVVWIEPGADATIRGDLKEGKIETIFEGKGSVRVMSTPKLCSVRFRGKTFEKTDAILNLTYVPAGKYRIVASWAGRELSSEILVVRGQRTVVTVSFLKGMAPFTIAYEPE